MWVHRRRWEYGIKKNFAEIGVEIIAFEEALFNMDFTEQVVGLSRRTALAADGYNNDALN